MIKRLNRLYTDYPRVKQVVSLFTVNIIMIPLSIISNIFITRFLGPVAYGDWKFIFYVMSLAMVIFNFGLFYAGNRAIVLNTDKEKTKELYGAMLFVLGGIFLIMAISLTIYAFVDHNISAKGLRSILLFIIPFSWIFLLTNYFEVLFQADNKISLLAKSRLYPKIIFFLAVLAVYIVLKNYTGDRQYMIWIAFITTHGAGFLYIIYKVHPSFSNMVERIREIRSFNKSYGFNVYIGTLFNVALASLSGMLIGYFSQTNAGVGYFALASVIAEPLNFIPNVIATTHYKEFSTKVKIEKRLTRITIGVSVLTILTCWVLVTPFINIFYGREFHPVIYLTFIISIGTIFSGMADYFNRFLGAHGQGKALRNSAIIVGVVIMICNFTLIPLFGEMGAAITRILSGLIYFVNMIWFYRKLVAKLALLKTEPELA